MKYKITSRYGDMESFRNHAHNGVDMKMEIGEPLRSIKSGVVHIRDYGSQNAGKTIILDGEDGRNYIYGHLSEFNVKEGQSVNEGDLIGLSGNSGYSTGAHLHFGVKDGGEYINPSPYIDSIQNMNNPQYLASIPKEEIITQSYSFSDLFNSNSDIYSNLFQSLKLHMINLFSLIDYSVFIQHFQNLFQFFS